MAPSAEDLLVELTPGDIIAWRFLSLFFFLKAQKKRSSDHLINTH